MAKSETQDGQATEVAVVDTAKQAPATQSTTQSAKVPSIAADVLQETGLTLDQMQQAMKQISSATLANIEDGEIQVSRIAIAQPTTPEVAGNDDGWQGGQLFDSMNREIITVSQKPQWMLDKGVPSSELKARHFVPVVPIFRLPSEYVLWPTKAEREAGLKKFHWKDLDVQSPRVKEGLWKPKGTWEGKGAPPVTEHLNILMFALDMDASIKTSLLIASFSRTSFRSGQKLVTSLNSHKLNKLPWWGRVYYLYTEPHKNEQNQTYYSIEFAKGSKLEEFGSIDYAKETYMHCFQQARALSDPQNGRALQEFMINAAALGEDDAASDGAPSDVPESTDEPLF